MGARLRLFLDDSEPDAGLGADIPDLRIVGGFCVTTDAEAALQAQLRTRKGQFTGTPDYPFKWNLQGLKREFKRRGESELLNALLPRSREIRRSMFLTLAQADVTIILSCLLAHSNRRTVLKKKKEDLARHAFSNALMRFALEVQEQRQALSAEVVMDWPDKGRNEPYDREYDSAFRDGATPEQVSYHAGPLSLLGFSDSLVYGNECYSVLLQAADLLVGAFRELLEVALGKRENAFGIEMLKEVSACMRGAPEQVFGRGIIVSPADTPVACRLQQAIVERLGCMG